MLTESIPEKTCENVFLHKEEQISEAFTNLWTQIINRKETAENINVAQTDILDL
ncbi:MAG: hypothetical protein NC548_43535 [Lachnospiraceae bacterium]|nr:hypothetical protein [Lachnospiraceae bacterium]